MSSFDNGSSLAPWVADSDVDSCQTCDTAFTMMRRKHHCRQCGKVVCDSCSKTKMVLPGRQIHGPVRVCDSCVAVLSASTSQRSSTIDLGMEDSDTQFVSQHASPVPSPIPTTSSSSSSSSNKPMMAIAVPAKPSNSTTTQAKTAVLARAVPTTTTPSSSSSSSSSVVAKDDLPMRLCIKILKKKDFEVQEQYERYLQAKSQKVEENYPPLTFRQYVFFCTIRTAEDDFLFNKTKLAFYMMKDSKGNKTVQRESFLRFAPVLPPLSSKFDADYVYEALADMKGGGYTEGVSENAFDMKRFTAFVAQMKKHNDLEAGWETLRQTFPKLPKEDRLFVVRKHVADSTKSMVPSVGRIGFLPHHLVFESNMLRSKTRFIPWDAISKIEDNTGGLLRGKTSMGFKLFIKPEEAKANKLPEILTWDMPGPGSEKIVTRHATREYLHAMVWVHKLVASILSGAAEVDVAQNLKPKFANMVLTEVCSNVARMFALEQLRANEAETIKAMEDLPLAYRLGFLNVSYTRRDPQAWLSLLAKVFNRSESKVASQFSSSTSDVGFFSKVFPKLSNRSEEATMGLLDPEVTLVPDIDEVEEDDEATKQPFHVKTLAWQLKRFHQLMEPLIVIDAVLDALKNWDMPYVSAFTCFFLLNMCYQDTLVYVPSLLVLLVIVVMLLLKLNPAFLRTTMHRYTSKGKDEAKEALISGSVDPQQIQQQPAKEWNGDDEEEDVTPVVEKKGLMGNFFDKIKNYRDVALKAVDGLENFQHKLARYNLKITKYNKLFLWEDVQNSTEFLGMLCVVYLVLFFIPFRFVFPFVVIDFFTEKWKRGGRMKRLLKRVKVSEEEQGIKED